MTSQTKIVASARGGPEVLQVVREVPPAPGAGEVLIRVHRAGVAFGDLLWMSGVVPRSPTPPYTPGYDVLGTVESTGPDVPEFFVGDRVAALLKIGGYAEWVCTSAVNVVKVPRQLSLDEAACLTLNYLTAWTIVHRIGELSAGDRMLVHGAGGGVGTALLDVGRAAGLEVYGTASAQKHDRVASFGATPIDYRAEDFVARIATLTGDGVDLVVDPLGGAHLARSRRALRRGGTLVASSAYDRAKGRSSALATALGMLRIPWWNLLPDRRSARLFDIVPYVRGHRALFLADMTSLYDLLRDGGIEPVIAERFPLSRARDALEMVVDGRADGKVLLMVSEPDG